MTPFLPSGFKKSLVRGAGITVFGIRFVRAPSPGNQHGDEAMDQLSSLVIVEVLFEYDAR